MAFGFAKIANVDGSPRFLMCQEFHERIRITDNLSVHPVILNGVPIQEESEKSFSYGDVLQVHYTYTDNQLLSRDTVVLVPEGTPAQFRA